LPASAAPSILSSSTAPTITTPSSAKLWAARARPRSLPVQPGCRSGISGQFKCLHAEYGNAGGAVINVVTKSGTNQFHGTGFEFFRTAVSMPPIRSPRRRARPNNPTISTSSAGISAARFSRTAFSSFLTTTASATSPRIWFLPDQRVCHVFYRCQYHRRLHLSVGAKRLLEPVVSIRMFICQGGLAYQFQ